MTAAATAPGVEAIFLVDRLQVEQIIDLTVAGNTTQMSDVAFRRELMQWIRFNPDQALKTEDGLFSGTNGNPSLPTWLGMALFDLVFRTDSENAKYVRQLRSSGGVVVFVSEHDDKDHWTRSGRACQRFALQATALGLKHAFVNQAVEVAAVREQLAAYLGAGDRRPDLVMRFGYGLDMPKSLRRPVEQVLVPSDPLRVGTP